MRISLMRVAVAVAAVVLTAGCATTHQLVPKPAADSISPGKVQIELHRTGQWYGIANGFAVKDHGQKIGTLGPKGTLFWESDPGDLDLLVGPTILNMGNFHQVVMKLDTGNRYSFETWFPFWYPFSRTGLKYLNKVKLRESTAAEVILSQETARQDAPVCMEPADSRGRWGIGLGAGDWAMDSKNFRKDINWLASSNSPGWGYSYRLEQETESVDMHLFYETNLRKNTVLGFLLGFGSMPTVHYNTRRYYNGASGGWLTDSDIKNETFYMPALFYGKISKGKLSFLAGAGINYMMLESTVRIDTLGLGIFSPYKEQLSGTFEASKFVPAVSAGVEYSFFRNLSLGINYKQLFAGKIGGLKGNVSDPGGIWQGSGKYRMVMVNDPPYGDYWTGKPASMPLLSNEKDFAFDFSGSQVNFVVKFYFGN